MGRRGKEGGKEEGGLCLVHEVTWKKRDEMTYFQDRQQINGLYSIGVSGRATCMSETGNLQITYISLLSSCKRMETSLIEVGLFSQTLPLAHDHSRP